MRTAGKRIGVWVAALLVCSCGADESGGGGASPPVEPVVEVTTTPVRRGDIRQSLSAPGSLEARRRSRIGAEVRGRIERVFVFEGDRVEEGDPLFRIDPEPYQIALRQAEAGLALARSERTQLEADLARGQALHRRNVMGDQELEQLKTSLAVARAAEQQAAETVALTRHKLDRTVARAPYAGSISERLADEGTTALDMPQTIVVVIEETTELEARVPIPESQLPVVRPGDAARLHIEGLDAPVESEVSAVSDTIDPATRTYLAKMRVPNPDYTLKAGLFVHAEILPPAKHEVLLAPRDAIRSEEGRTRVLVVRDGQAAAVPVRLGVIGEHEVEIVSGLQGDERLVVGEAARTLAPGMRVRAVDVASRTSP